MSNIPHSANNRNGISGFVEDFFHEFHIGRLLFKCNAGKQKGIPVVSIFRYLPCLIFSDRSMYMQMRTGTFMEAFSKNSVYRFLNSARTNWLRFMTLLSVAIITDFMKPFTSDDRKDVFIIDDSLFDRSRSKKTELPARVFDHCSMKSKRGFRMLTLGWSDGNPFVPINHCLLSAAEDSNLLVRKSRYDGRTLAAKRRKLSRGKATEVMLGLVRPAQKAGISARYILFDSWFGSPKTIIPLKKDMSLDTIAMLKKCKTKYGYQGMGLNAKEIYSRNKKRRGRSRYLLSVQVALAKGHDTIPAKLVFVRNKSNRKDWMVLISTDTDLSEDEVIRIYGKRWDIEVFFKSCKSYLHLVKECRGMPYDALTAHVSIVFTRYMLLSVAQRRSTDERTICELCLVLLDEMGDISFSRSMQIILDALMGTVMEYFQLTEEQLGEFLDNFIDHLPKYMQEALQKGDLVV